MRYRRVNATVTQVVADYERRLHECRVERDRLTIEGALMTAEAERAATACRRWLAASATWSEIWFWRARLLWLRLKGS